MRAIPTFKRGEVPRAESFSMLVAAVRELLQQYGLVHVVRRQQPRRVYFTPAGSCTARQDAEGNALGLVSEWLWQCGSQVKLLPAGAVAGINEALERAAEDGAATGLHGHLRVVHHGYGMLFEIEATAVEYQAAAWIEQPESEDGVLDDSLLHGDVQVGCVTGAANTLHQRQRATAMWAQPQFAAIVYREAFALGLPEVYGSAALLPCPDLQQVLGHAAGGYYVGNDPNAEFISVSHCWCGRLDIYGQLHFGAKNL